MVETGKRSRPHRDNHHNNNNNGGHRNQRRRIERDDRMEFGGSGDELVAYRILCPDTVIGSVIGKGGKVINSIRVESRAKVKVVDPFPGAKDRVITIYCYVKEKAEVGLDEEYNDNKPLCPSQDALMRMHAAIADAVATLHDPERNHGNREECTILVPASQSANVIGKGGSNIKKLRMKTRAHIKVVPKDVGDPAHSCAMDFDNFIQITGDSEAVKKALFAVSAIVYKFPPKEEIPLDTTVSEIPPSIIIPADMPIYPATGFFGGGDPMVPPPRSAGASLMDAHAPELPVPGYADPGSMWPVVLPSYGGAARTEELTIRVLCPSDKIGRVIGKGGSVIKSVRQASGAHIQVDDTKKDKCDECLIIVTTTEALDDVQSKAVEAVLLLQEKINEDAEDVTFRFLVPSRNIGCIIGKGGSIINEIRKRSGAHIRISKGEKPKYVDPSDEYIEVSGEVKNVRDALIQLVLRLRDDVLNDKDGSSKPPVAAEPLYGGGKGLSVPPLLPPAPPVKPLGYEPRTEAAGGLGMFSSSGPYKYGSYSLEGPMDMWGMQNFDKPEPTKAGYRMGDDDYRSAYPSNLYGGLLPSSTLEILIPANAVGKVIGKSGANIANIRQISGAVIEISEPKSSRGDRIAHISGTPEQKRSAENLIQAFIMAT